MELPEHYLHDSESYLELFSAHAKGMANLMRALDEEIINAALPPVGRSKELFRMTLDLSYQVDRAYKNKHNIKGPDVIISTYMRKDELKEDVRNIFVEEFNRFLSIQNNDK
jgi:hypothetical protein